MKFRRIVQLKTLILFCVALISCIDKQQRKSSSTPESLVDPHMLPSKGPWFEGWYVRFTPTSGTNRSFGAIVGSYLPPELSRRDAESLGLPGYFSILESGLPGAPLRAFEEFPSMTRMFKNRTDAVERDPHPRSAASFRWAAEGFGELTEESVSLKAKNGGAGLKASWSGGVPWNRSLLGPEGFISLVRAFPLHWFVYSLGSSATFEVDLPDPQDPSKRDRVQGSGYVHFEKNWGVSFPQSYVWLQAHDTKSKTMVALAGGRPFEVAGIQPEAWLVGFRSDRFQQDFAPQNVGTLFKSDVDACRGQFRLTASFLNRKMILLASADRKTFGGIAIPKDSGFEKNGSEQSFQTDIVVRLYEVSPLFGGGDRLLEESSFRSGALEFGGAFKCSGRP